MRNVTKMHNFFMTAAEIFSDEVSLVIRYF